uniref:C25 family cysteine peptidase n=1 Tax=Prevotella heparinolytica TaxID=28113 RepID=UPI0035A1098C
SGIYGAIPEEGEPSLPTRQINLMLPFGQTVDSIMLTNVVTSSFNVVNDVFPAQTQSEGNVPFCSPKGSIYNSNAAYPVLPVKVSGQGYFALNNNILTLDVCPFEYHPLTKQLTLITSMTITVSLKNGYLGGVQQVSRLAKSQELYNNLLLSVVDNPQQINSYAIPSTTITEFGVNASGLPVYEYVIITPTAFADAFHDFVNWKRMKGINAGIVTMETISTTYQGDCIYPIHPIYDEAGKVRQYLYESAPLGTTWVLVAGDNVGLNVMPYREAASTSSSIPTDLILI